MNLRYKQYLIYLYKTLDDDKVCAGIKSLIDRIEMRYN